VLLITAVSESDAEAGKAVDELVTLTDTTLSEIQSTEGIPDDERITLVTLTQDEKGVVGMKNRMVAAGGAAVGVGVLTLLLVALIDGLSRSRSRRRGRKRPVPPGLVLPEDATDTAADGIRDADYDLGDDEERSDDTAAVDTQDERLPAPPARGP